MQSVIRKFGALSGAVLPPRVLAQAGLHAGDEVDIKAHRGEIIIRHAHLEYTLEKLVAETPASNRELDDEDKQWLNDSPRGKELI
jgi:antitoxin MazE